MKTSTDLVRSRTRNSQLACLLGALFLAGCASTDVTSSHRLVYERLPRPNHIFVYDFGASPSDVPSDSSLAGQPTTYTPPTEQELTIGRELGSSIASQLAERIREMGLPGVQGVQGATAPQVHDIVIRGYLVTIEEGSAGKRMAIGFGSGGSELTTAVEGYQMTPQGLRKLGSATLGSESGKGPGASLGAAGWLITGSPVGLIVGGRAKQTAKEIAAQLKKRFQEEGWIP
jgi:hypothetical protein